MSHLVAYFGNEPENLACALFSARAALYSERARRGTRNDGFGLGFVQGGDVLLRKRPRAETSEVDLYGLARDTRAEALVGRVGLAQTEATTARRSRCSVRAEDADPFRFRSWLFGSISEVSRRPRSRRVRERVLESTPAFLRRNIRGLSPSEHLFHLFLAFLHDAGLLDQPTPPPTAVHVALRNSLAFVDRLLVRPDRSPLKIALAATNGRCFVATGLRVPDALPARRGDLRLPGLPRRATIAATRSAAAAGSRTRRCAPSSSRRIATSRRGPAGTTSPIARR